MIVCHGGKHRTGCGQCYHISCINRSEVPPGDWICMTCAQSIGQNVDIKGFEYLVDVIDAFDTSQQVQESIAEKDQIKPYFETTVKKKKKGNKVVLTTILNY